MLHVPVFHTGRTKQYFGMVSTSCTLWFSLVLATKSWKRDYHWWVDLQWRSWIQSVQLLLVFELNWMKIWPNWRQCSDSTTHSWFCPDIYLLYLQNLNSSNGTFGTGWSLHSSSHCSQSIPVFKIHNSFLPSTSRFWIQVFLWAFSSASLVTHMSPSISVCNLPHFRFLLWHCLFILWFNLITFLKKIKSQKSFCSGVLPATKLGGCCLNGCFWS